MIELRVQNVITQVFNADILTEDRLYASLSFRDPGYIFSPLYKTGRWDGWNRLYYRSNKSRLFGKFWTGLLSQAREVLDKENIPYQIIDLRVEPTVGPPIPCYGINIRDDQTQAIQQVKEYSRGIVKAATGAGKTFYSTRLIAELNVPSLFLVHRKNLLNQTKKEFEKILKVPIGIIQAENRKLEKFNVATVQTLSRILKEYQNPEIRDFIQNICQLLIVDECHHSVSASHRFVIQNFISAYYRVGLSATPKTGKDSDMYVEALFGKVISEKSREESQAEKVLAKPYVFFI